MLERIIVAAVEKINEAGDARFGVDGKINNIFLGLLAPDVSLAVGRWWGGVKMVVQTFIPLVHIAIIGRDWHKITFLCTLNSRSPQRILRSENSPVLSKLYERLAIYVTDEYE